ncbi:hypothetical protein LSAT2_001007 [Lamellibrachia satsuma]|nr:hypothetical protein LSAT2_001007 [Lamellibrachia satsuma]
MRWTYYKSDKCVPCPIGQYQDLTMQTICKNWHSGFATENIGTIDQDMCHRTCPMGNPYDHTTSRCQPCERGFYQDEEAQFVCKPCPVTKSTAGTGSTSQSQCIGCEPCPRETYQPKAGEVECIKCSPGKSTAEEGAQYDNQCKDIKVPLNTTFIIGGSVGALVPTSYIVHCVHCLQAQEWAHKGRP